MKTICFLAVSAIFFACNKPNADVIINPLDGLTKLKEGFAVDASAKVEIWGEKNFFVGYNNLIVVIYDSINIAKKVTNAHIHFMPIMTMGTGNEVMQEATPVENPDEFALDGAFPGAVAFVMPSGPNDVWHLGVEVHNHLSGKEGEAEFDITVDNPATPVLTVFSSLTAGNSILALSLVQPKGPKTGMNEIEFTIHREASMLDWQPDDSYTIEITPEMPAMGHGSEDNVNPVNQGNGHYKGKVNLISPGEWRVNILVKKDGIAASQNLFFNITI